MAGNQDQEKTEPATGKKREEARSKGNIASSQEAVTAVVLLASALVLIAQGGELVGAIRDLIERTFRTLYTRSHADPIAAFRSALLLSMQLAMPMIGMLMLASVGVTVAQIGSIDFNLERMAPSFARLDPIAGFARLFSLRSAIKLLTAFLKVTVLCLIAWYTVRDDLPRILHYSEEEPSAGLTSFTAIALKLALRVGIALLVLGAADYFYQLWQHEKDLRMTKMEVREESKSSEGDPHIRGRQRSAARRMARQRVVEAVPSAAVVIVNPSHYAVALEYEVNVTPAPRLLAKGRDYLALRIMEVAREHGVPIHRDQPLARALYRDVDVGVSIPPKFYKAVAVILAHVLRQRARARGVRS